MTPSKPEVLDFCLQKVSNAIAEAEKSLQLAEESAKDDTKSSAGDKYETGREMAQQEINRNKQILQEARQRLQTLLALPDTSKSHQVGLGTLVHTDKLCFFVSIGLGAFTLSGYQIVAVSANSPIGKCLLGAKQNDCIEFNGQRYTILKLD